MQTFDTKREGVSASYFLPRPHQSISALVLPSGSAFAESTTVFIILSRLTSPSSLQPFSMASSIYRLGNLSPQAVAGILCSLPLAASMFYILSAKTGIFASRSRGYLNETRCRLLYVFTEFLMGGIILTYVRQSLGSVRAHQVSLSNADRPGLGIILCPSRSFPANCNNLGRRHCKRPFLTASLDIPYRTDANFLC